VTENDRGADSENIASTLRVKSEVEVSWRHAGGPERKYTDFRNDDELSVAMKL
jgi:hypothetical protein